MICNDAKPLLNLLYDDVLDVKDSVQLLEHLKSCVDCSQEWTGLEQLRSRFHIAKNTCVVPADLEKKIVSALDGPVHRAASFNVKMFLLAVAAITMLVLIVRPILNMVQHLPIQASAQNLVCETSAGVVAQTFTDRSQLSQKLGYEFKTLKISNWTRSSFAVCTAETRAPLARVDFTSTQGEVDAAAPSKPAKLICYEAPPGTFTSDKPQTDLNGKKVRFGVEGDYRYAMWTANGRDFLIISTISQDSFVKLISGA
jgi:hypothetical protein